MSVKRKFNPLSPSLACLLLKYPWEVCFVPGLNFPPHGQTSKHARSREWESFPFFLLALFSAFENTQQSRTFSKLLQNSTSAVHIVSPPLTSALLTPFLVDLALSGLDGPGTVVHGHNAELRLIKWSPTQQRETHTGGNVSRVYLSWRRGQGELLIFLYAALTEAKGFVSWRDH